jgi:hypothetical protein
MPGARLPDIKVTAPIPASLVPLKNRCNSSPSTPLMLTANPPVAFVPAPVVEHWNVITACILAVVSRVTVVVNPVTSTRTALVVV